MLLRFAQWAMSDCADRCSALHPEVGPPCAKWQLDGHKKMPQSFVKGRSLVRIRMATSAELSAELSAGE